MNLELWHKILAFDFDNPPSEYDFSTRLANENYWTKTFTDLAILEYKKFMYLAATSDLMVSPSEIVDTVWHQHLIFTQSYQDFCNLIGRQIQHIPSTHNKEDFQKFKTAKERTTQFYERTFGQLPKSIWHYNNMFESLNLEKANFKIRTFLIFGILAFIILTTPTYFVLKPIYIKIDNPYFILGLAALTIFILLTLEFYNRNKLKEIVSQFDLSSFIYDLQPFELIYLKTQKLSGVINGIVNELIEKGTVIINSDSSVELIKSSTTTNKEQLQVTSVLTEIGPTFYSNLLRILSTKPIFWNFANAMDAFKKYLTKSKKFGQLFYTNFAVLSILLLCSFTRVVTGILREKPVTQIVILTIVLVVIIIAFLQRLTKLGCTKTIPELYINEILPTRQVDTQWQWRYFLLGTAVLTPSFVPLTKYIERNNDNSSSCGTSCGSSCGSSCSSCGGCGGD